MKNHCLQEPCNKRRKILTSTFRWEETGTNIRRQDAVKKKKNSKTWVVNGVGKVICNFMKGGQEESP